MVTVAEAANLAIAHYNAGRLPQAEELCRAILTSVPGQPTALEVMGACRYAAGDTAQAQRCFHVALCVEPAAARLYRSLGNMLSRAGRADRAGAVLRHAVRIAPGVEQMDAYGLLLADQGRNDQAAAPLRLGLALEPARAEANRRLAIVEQRRGALAPARRLLRRAHRLGASDAVLAREALVLPIIPQSEEEIADCRRRFLDVATEMVERGARIDDPLRTVGSTAFFLSYHGLDNRAAHTTMARAYAAACPELLQTAAHCRTPKRPGPGERIRLGILSDHLFGHTIGQLNRGLVEKLSRERFHVTLFMTDAPEDPIRQQLRAAADAVVPIPTELNETRRRVADARLDILYYPDIGMSPFTYFLAFSRLAPVQCLTWGHPDTTGIPTLDAFLTCDAMEPEGAESHYSERLVRLPGTTLFYHRPQPPQTMRTRAEFGLPDDANIYLCPQSLFKIHPQFDAVLIDLLRRDPRGLLVFVDPRGQGTALMERLGPKGPDVRDRILFLPGLSNPDFLSLIACSTVMLDPPHYSGGNTSLEAFSLGMPIVTWPGGFMRGRHTHGFYRLMGMDDCVARDLEHYRDLALTLGTEPGARAWVSRRILERNAVLFEDAASIRAIEHALIDSLRRAIP